MLSTWGSSRGASSSLIAAPFATVNGSDGTADFPDYINGFTAEYAGTPSISTPVPFSVTRQGFTGTDSATTDTHASVATIVDTMYVTSRVRTPFQVGMNSGNFYSATYYQPNRVSLSDYIYSTDTPAGVVTNNSTVTSPVPVAAWATPHRQTVGNTLAGEIVAFHRDAAAGKQVACVVVTATDGTHTATCTVATPTISTRTSDQHPVIVYAWSLDITALNDNALVTVNAKVYPRIGTSPTSVADSSLLAYASHEREFSPRYYLKNTTLAAAPVYAVLDPGGSSGGVFSTNPATAAATPFDTAVNMINKINSGATGSPTKADGVIVHVAAGTFVLPTTASALVNQNVACLTFTRKPGVARASAILTFGTGNFRPRLGANLTSPLATGCVRFTDVTVTRTGTGTLQGESTGPIKLEVQFDDVTYGNGSTSNGNVYNNSSTYIYGMVSSTASVAVFSANGSGFGCIVRGLSSTGGTPGIDPWCVLGCDIDGASLNVNVNSVSGAIVAFNTLMKLPASTIMLNIGDTQNVLGFAVVQNVFETITNISTGPIHSAGDSSSGNTDHIIFHNNTVIGYNDFGKANLCYDEGPSRRYSIRISFKGNFWTQSNTKGDVFVGLNNNGTPDPTEAPFRIQDWAYLYGAGVQGDFVNYINTGNSVPPTSFIGPAYGGVGSLLGTSQTVPQAANNLFTNYQGTTWSGSGTTGTAGAGRGTYSWGSTSPVKGIVTSAVLPYDLAGAARPTTSDSASAYVSP